MYTLQRRVRVLRDQLQKKDLQLELLKRKVLLMEDGVKGKCLVQVTITTTTMRLFAQCIPN